MGMTQFASVKKSKDSEPLVSFLPRLVLEPGLVLNLGATALRNSVVSLVWLVCDTRAGASGHWSISTWRLVSEIN